MLAARSCGTCSGSVGYGAIMVLWGCCPMRHLHEVPYHSLGLAKLRLMANCICIILCSAHLHLVSQFPSKIVIVLCFAVLI